MGHADVKIYYGRISIECTSAPEKRGATSMASAINSNEITFVFANFFETICCFKFSLRTFEIVLKLCYTVLSEVYDKLPLSGRWISYRIYFLQFPYPFPKLVLTTVFNKNITNILWGRYTKFEFLTLIEFEILYSPRRHKNNHIFFSRFA